MSGTTDDSGRPRRSALKPARFRDEDDAMDTKPPVSARKETRGRKRLAHSEFTSPNHENFSSSRTETPPESFSEGNSFVSRSNREPEFQFKTKSFSPTPTKKEKLHHDRQQYDDEPFDEMPTTSALALFNSMNNQSTTSYVAKLQDSPETDLLEKKLRQTIYGDTYATVNQHRLKDFFMKNNIIDLCANPIKAEQFRSSGCFLTQPPRLPPITTGIGCYLFYIDGTQCHNAHALSSDDLRPWSSLKDPRDLNSISIKANVRRHPIARLDGKFVVVTRETGLAEYYLTEYSARLPREERLRKKIFYMTRNNQTFGNVLIIYNYTNEGRAPEVLGQNSYDKSNNYYHPVRQSIPVYQAKNREPVNQAELMHPDSLEYGFDSAFSSSYDDYERDERTGYYRGTRILSTGHTYLTICNKRAATTMTNVLDWIINTNEVKQRKALNDTKPPHPPLVTNDRAYAFFVAGTSVETFNMTQDDFSPWSSNGTLENPTCFRTKVRKIGVEQNGNGNYMLSDEEDYRKCPYHLVFLYATNPRDTRLTKKIFYVVDAASKMIISQALIIYDYRQVGDVPKLNSSAKHHSSKQPTTSSNIRGNYFEGGSSGYTEDHLKQPKEEDDYQIPVHFMF
ncbi:hypothetical protein CAEBREN_17475 [Caenorhabditis brenneri]|uniref:DUF7747 domain-containing protein n=1 Tax=Caenorhabditis brenneri TaxID=135651 RepID=G0P858_CAEBE|nr:hypothetical protein CAEBREN_17475 [Caenorhabditis brenneri]